MTTPNTLPVYIRDIDDYHRILVGHFAPDAIEALHRFVIRFAGRIDDLGGSEVLWHSEIAFVADTDDGAVAEFIFERTVA